jgi:hypothetical protein
MKKKFTLNVILVMCFLFAQPVYSQITMADANSLQALIFSPDETDVVYASKGNNIYKSIDKGTTWGDAIYTHPSASGLISKLAFLSGNDLYLYFNVFNPNDIENGGLYKFRLSSEEVFDVKTGVVVSDYVLGNGGEIALADAVSGNNYFAADGNTFESVLPGKKLNSIAFEIVSGWSTYTLVYGTTDNGVWQHQNQYGQWYDPSTVSGYDAGNYTAFKVYGYYHAGYMMDVTKSFIGAKPYDVNDGKLAIHDPNAWPSNSDAAVTWNGNTAEDYPRVIASAGDVIWAGEYDEIAFSSDQGITWQTKVFTTERTALSISFNPADTNDVIVVCQNGVIHTTDMFGTYTALTNVPTPTTFGQLLFYAKSGATDSYNVDIQDGDGIATVTVDGTIGDNFDISTNGELTIKSDVTLEADTLTGIITVTDNSSNETTANVSVIVMDAVDAVVVNKEFTVLEKTDADFPLDVDITDENGIISVEFDTDGLLDDYFAIDNEGLITLNVASYLFTADNADTIGGKVIITDILGDMTTDSITVFVDAKTNFYNTNISLEETLVAGDTLIDLNINDGDGIASISLGGNFADYFEIYNEDTMAIKSGVTLIPGKIVGYIKVIDVLSRETFNSAINIEITSSTPEEQITTVLLTTEGQTHIKSNNSFNNMKFGCVEPNGVKKVFLEGDGIDPVEDDLDQYFTTYYNSSRGEVNVNGKYGNSTALYSTIVGKIGVIDNLDDTTMFDVTISVISETFAYYNNYWTVDELSTDDTLQTMNIYNLTDYGRTGYKSVTLEGDITDYFTNTVDTLIQKTGVNYDYDLMPIIRGFALVTNMSDEVQKIGLTVNVVPEMVTPGDTVDIYTLPFTGEKEIIIPISDKAGFKSVKYYHLSENSMEEFFYPYINGDTSLVLSSYDMADFVEGDYTEGTVQFADNFSKNLNMTVNIHVFEISLTDIDETVVGANFESLAVGIEGLDYVESISLTGDLLDYFEISETGVITIKSGVVLDNETLETITGTVELVDMHEGQTFSSAVSISTYNVNVTDSEITVVEDEFTELQITIAPVDYIETVSLTDELTTYFDISATGLITLKSGAELDFTVDNQITGNVKVVDNILGETFTGSVVINLEEAATTGINDISFDSNSTIYPNPVSALITVTNVDGKQIDIYNAVGVLVKSFNSDAEMFTANIGDLETGIYIVRISGSINDITSLKLYKK